MRVYALIFFLSFFASGASIAQEKNTSGIRITISAKDRPFREVLSIIESQIPFKFAYDTELILRQRNVSIGTASMLLPDVLDILLPRDSLNFTIIGDQIVLHNMVLPSKITLSGYITDSTTGEMLPEASIYIPTAEAGVFCNSYGFYSITVPSVDTMNLEISYVGYKSQFKKVSARNNLTLSFGLKHDEIQEEVNKLIIANDKREDNVRKNQSALIELPPNMIVASPSICGSGDVVNSVQMLPGVQAGFDGSPGYFVRGGNNGQNLILLDEATLYNPSHVFGLVGIFNTPAIKSASLIKGGFPASYGDHVSSVLDIAMKDGSNQQFGGTIQMGSISSGVTLYGPLRPFKSSYLISARRSMVDLLLGPILKNNYFSNYYFYDVNAKLNFQPGRKDRLLLSFYTGRDNNIYSTNPIDNGGFNYSMHFGNSAFTMRWNHAYSGKLYSNTSLIYNHYHQFLSAAEDGYFAQLYSGIRDKNVKTDFTYYASPEHKISAGADYLYQTLYPASLSQKINSGDSSVTIRPDTIPVKIAARLAVYASDDMKIGRRFKVYLGVRIPFYYRPDVRYLFIEPRLSLLYMIDPATSVKVSYTHMHQYIHLVQSYNSSFPAEMWIGSSNIVRPQTSREVSAGIFKNFKGNDFQASLELYCKHMENQLLFRGVTTPAIDDNLEDQLIFGKGWSYGTELFVRKNRGKWTGWLAYSLVYAYQKFDSLYHGQPFPFANIRRHKLNISTGYAFNKYWKISANFLIASGRTFTHNINPGSSSNPNSNPLFDDENSNGSGNSIGKESNNQRLGPHNRLDLSISYKKSRITRRGSLETEWVFSVYNVYARRNSSFVYRTIDPATRQVIANEVSLIPVIPSITYSCKF